MLEPSAIIELADGTTVETRDGPEDNVDRVAVWDWYELDDDGEALLELHTNSGDAYVPKAAVADITVLE